MPVPVHALATTEQYLAVLDGHPTKFAPGERFSYSNGGYVVLALIAERASGIPFHDLVRQRVCAPAGMVDTEFLRSDELPGRTALGYAEIDGAWRTNVHHLPVRGSGDGGIYSTVADMSALWRAFFAGRIVPERWVRDMVRPRSDDAAGMATASASGCTSRPTSSCWSAPTRACRSAPCTIRARASRTRSSRTRPTVPGRSPGISETVSVRARDGTVPAARAVRPGAARRGRRQPRLLGDVRQPGGEAGPRRAWRARLRLRHGKPPLLRPGAIPHRPVRPAWLRPQPAARERPRRSTCRRTRPTT